METMPAPWVPKIACRPLAFAQVREDATLDQWVVEQLDGGAEVLIIASGGCTAAALAASSQISRLHLIDLNPAQIALTRLKLRLLATAEAGQRASVLGHTSMPVAERRQRVIFELQKLGLPVDALGPIDLVAELGPDHVGRYEGLFSKLREALSDASDEISALLQLHDPDEQARRTEEGTHLGRTLDAAFDSVMALPHLIGLFGEAATRNRCEPFSRHFARRTRHALATLPAVDNPYLWQIFHGRFPHQVRYPWLMADVPSRICEIQWSVTGMAEALYDQHEAYDFIHVSNILDWLTQEEAGSMLDLVWQALRPGGWTLIRQLNSNLDIKRLAGRFDWQDKSAAALHKRDRSFFYRELHLGRK